LVAGSRRASSRRALHEAGYHKQIVNRILEPYAHIKVVITSSQWLNFFGLRLHKDAQPEIRELARLMHEAMMNSTPTRLEPGQWHLPYVTEEDREEAQILAHTLSWDAGEYWNRLIRASVARCARTSYLNYDGSKASIQKDLELYDKLVGSEPLHASPAEHQATPDTWVPRLTGRVTTAGAWARPELGGNLGPGWIQHRKTLPNENLEHPSR
jgi:hypothetical protein